MRHVYCPFRSATLLFRSFFALQRHFHSHILNFRFVGVFFLLAAVGLFAPVRSSAAGTWTVLTNSKPSGGQHPMLLTDGTVIFLGQPCTRLTPDIHGSYVNGTWTTLAPMHDSRTYYSSQVLPDGRVFVCGGEYGTGKNRTEIYDPMTDVWTQEPDAPDTVIDNISETLPNGNILEGSPGSDIRIYDIVSNTWSAKITPFGGQDESSWVKLQDGSVLTFTGTSSERFIPALNKWVVDTDLPAPLYGWGYELGHGLLLPTGQAIFFGGTGTNCVYTPWTTNAAGAYTPNGATNAGTWTVVAPTPNFNAPIDAPAAMLVNGKILCCMTATNNGFGSTSRFYEYDYVANSFTAINAPEGGTIANHIAYGTEMLDLPDGTVLVTGQGSLCVYNPGGTPLAGGKPAILSATTNLDGSFHVTGTLFNGISEGAGYGDDWQMNTDFPIARMTNSSGNVFYARTYNWSTCNLMTGTNVVTTEMTLPPGMLAGTYPLFVTANGISSAPFSLTINGTPLPPVANLMFTGIASNKMVFKWSDIGLTETGYVVQRSSDGTNYSTLTTLSGATTNYTDNAVTPLGQYYYRVLGTNSVGLGNAAPAIFAASPPVVPVPLPWQNQDVGAVVGQGASGTNGGGFTVIGSGDGISADNDQFQFVYQPVIGDVAITARVLTNQNTGSNAMAGVMIRSSLGFDVADALMIFDGGAQASIFEHRDSAAALATYGLVEYGEPEGEPSGPGGVSGSPTVVSQPASAPLWVRLVRSGNTITGFTSTDGSTWTQQGTTTVVMAAVVEVGLAVTSGTYNQLNTSTFDNVTVTGTPALTPPPVAEWKLDETSGATAEDSIDSFDGLYNNVVLGQPGAAPATGLSAGFNGTNADISIPPLNLNSNVLTLTAWVNRSGNQAGATGLFFNRANATVSGLNFYNSTANELGYTWNGNSSTYNWHSGLIVPNNQWTFVALVIEPTRARIFMATNGVFFSATNNVANAVQAFDGASFIGQDSLGGRFFKGLLDEVQFFNQALTPVQLAQLAAPPVVNLTSPSNGAVLPAFASVNLSVALSATNGHVMNLVQYFSDNGQLLGQSATPPFSATTTNLNIGTYAVFGRLFYDSGFSVDSPLDSVIVSVQPSVTNTWDANGSVAGAQDGSGKWGGGTNWWTGSADVAWADYNLAVFGAGTATNCTVTLTNDVTPYAITFSAGTGSYTLAGTNSIWLTVPGTPLNITASGNATISAPLQGDNSLVKLGSGKLTLTASNNYAGATVVAAGMLKLGINTAFGSSASITNTGTLDLNGQDFTASMFGSPVTISGAGAGVGGTAITNGAAARGQLQDVELGGDATIGGANPLFIGGTNAVNGVLNLNGYTLTKAGSGTLVLNGVSLAGPGNLTISAGTLQLMDNYTGGNQQNTILAGSGNLTINAGASVMTYKWGSTLTVSMPVIMNGGTLGSGWPGPNGATYVCPILVNSNSTFNFSGGYDNCTFSGNITGNGGLTITGGSATRTFTGNNSYGWTTINSGVLKIGNAGTTGSLGLGNVTNNDTLTFSRTDNVSVTNRISGSGTVTQSGGGTLSLFGTNLYTGGTTLDTGTLNVSAPETAGTSGPLGKSGSITFTGGTLQYSAVNAFDYSSRFSTATNQPYNIDTAGQNVIFAAALTSVGGGSLTKLGAGTLTLAGANTYDGPTAVGAGTLAVTGSVKGGGDIIVSNGAALLVRANGGISIITNAASLTFGTGGATSFTVSNFVGNANAPVNVATLSASGTVTVNLLGLPPLGQFPLINYTGSIGGSGYAAFALGAVPSGVFVTLSNNTANSSVDVVVATNNLIWSGAVNGTWDTGVTANWTRGGASSTFNSNAGAQFDDTAAGTTAVTLNAAVSASAVNFANSSKNYSISGNGSIGGGATLVKGGTGTVTLATTNTYAGSTTVNAGTLLVNGTLPAGTVTVAAGSLLAGSGKVYGPTTVQPGGILRPGAGGTDVASLTISNSLSLAGTVLFTLNRTNALTASKIAGLGSVTCGGTLTVTNVGSTNFASGDAFTLLQATNYSGSFTNLTLPVLSAGLFWNTNKLVVNGTILVSNYFYTLTYSAGTNGTISGISPQTVVYGTNGTPVTAVPTNGYHFVNWSDGSVANPRTDAGVTNSISVIANFAINTYTLTYNAGTNGTISGTSPQTVNYGSNGVAVTAVPTNGYHFVNWSDSSTSNPRTDLNVTNNITVTANFAINTYTLTYIAVTNGTISGTSPQTVNYGASGTTVTAVPTNGYHFVNWSDSSTANPRTELNVTNSITVTANFAINTYTLTYSAGPNGTISGTSPQTVNYGASGTSITAVPASGYAFTNWSDGNLANPRTDSNVTNSLSVTANFVATTAVPPVITGSPVLGSGGLQLTFSGPPGQTYKILASPDLLQPMTNWTVLTSGTFGASPVTYTNSVPPATPGGYYRIASP